MRKIRVRDKLKEIYCPGELVIVDFFNTAMMKHPKRIAKVNTNFSVTPDEFYETLCKSVKDHTEDILFPMDYEVFMDSIILNKPNMTILRDDRPHNTQYIHIIVWSYAEDRKDIVKGKYRYE